MSSDPSALFGAPEQPAWAPSEAARGRLLLGAVAVLVTTGLTAAGLGASLLNADAGGFKVDRALEWAALLPQLGVLMALLALARESQSRGLWKSSIGFLGVCFLWLVFALALDEQLAKQVRVSAVVVAAVGALLLLIMALGNWPRFPETLDGQPGTTRVPSKNGKNWLVGILVPLFLILARVFAKGFRRLKLGGEQWLTIEACVLGLLLLVFIVWFAWTKIQLSEKFGKVSFLLGAFELFVLLAALAGVGSFLAVAAPSMAQGNNAEVERLLGLWEKGATLGGMAVCVIWGALAAWLFLSVRKLGERDWRFEFSADGVRPWQ